MPLNAVLLSTEDKAILDEIIGRVKKTRTNVSSQGKGDLRSKQSYPVGAYIALPVENSGIPALEAVGVDPDPEDMPGRALCDIYKVDSVSGQMRSIAKQVPVYNISTSDSSKAWTLVVRTPFGEWVATPQGAPGEIILFQIQEMDPVCCGYADSVVVAGPCSGSPKMGDSVLVYDEAECFFNEPTSELEGRFGFATRLLFMDITSGSEDPCEGEQTGTGTGTGNMCAEKTSCRWVVFSLCCGTI